MKLFKVRSTLPMAIVPWLTLPYRDEQTRHEQIKDIATLKFFQFDVRPPTLIKCGKLHFISNVKASSG